MTRGLSEVELRDAYEGIGSSVPVSEVKLLQPLDTVTTESDCVADTQ